MDIALVVAAVQLSVGHGITQDAAHIAAASTDRGVIAAIVKDDLGFQDTGRCIADDTAHQTSRAAAAGGNGGPVNAQGKAGKTCRDGKAGIPDGASRNHILNGGQAAAAALDVAEQAHRRILKGDSVTLAIKGTCERSGAGADTGPIRNIAQIDICGQLTFDAGTARIDLLCKPQQVCRCADLVDAAVLSRLGRQDAHGHHSQHQDQSRKPAQHSFHFRFHITSLFQLSMKSPEGVTWDQPAHTAKSCRSNGMSAYAAQNPCTVRRSSDSYVQRCRSAPFPPSQVFTQ